MISDMMNTLAPMIGGTICPPQDATASTAPENTRENPVRIISGMVKAPVVTTFAIVLPDSDGEGARNCAIRCQREIAKTMAQDSECRTPLTISFGVSELGEDPVSAMTLIERADVALLRQSIQQHLGAEEQKAVDARSAELREEGVSAELADLVALPPDVMMRYPLEISGGQRQRVSLMRALMLDPDLLLLDEPLGALDPMIRYGLQKELKRIFETLRKTVIMVTHDVAEAAFFADRIVLMRDGRIVQQGSMSELAGMPVEPFVTDFINAQREPFEKLHEVLD